MERMGALALTATVLRDPRRLLDAADDPADLAWLAPRLLAIGALGAALFGAVVGSYRGGIQIGFAGLKMPLLFLIPLIVGLPAVRRIFGVSSLERVGLAGLLGLARSAVLAAALSPVLWLLYSTGADYHLAVLALVAAIALVGLPGLATVRLALPGRVTDRLLAVGASIVVLGAITAQTGWLLRPFVARPGAEVALLRPVEEDVFSSLNATFHAAVGDYQDWESEPSGLVGRGLRREGR